MRSILAVVVALFVLGCGAEERAEERCREDCPTYGATFVRVSCNGDACGERESQWECWCHRHGAEAGGPREPLRIW
jgi:hypothetical protein